MPCQECPSQGTCLILTSDMHIQVTAVAVQAMQEAAVEGSASLIKASNSYLGALVLFLLGQILRSWQCVTLG